VSPRPNTTRHLWAVEQLAPRPTDHILEIGCGPGVATQLICERLTTGRLVAIDRSKTAITAARIRNQAHESAGKATFLRTALDQAEFRGQRFDKILAINVNVFWLNPATELEAIHKVLKPGGRLTLVYQPPTAAQTKRIAEATSTFLRNHGFSTLEVTQGNLHPGTAVCIQARTRKA
jgi:ubiquinone/menaquinone biosynthesis C-methylase UbiE